MGPHGGVVLSWKSMAWLHAECLGSSKDALVIMMGMNSEYFLGTQSMAAWSSSCMAAATVRITLFSLGSKWEIC